MKIRVVDEFAACFDPCKTTGGFPAAVETAEGNRLEENVLLLKEHVLAVCIGSRIVARLVCTVCSPTDISLLAIGRLVSSGIVKNLAEITELYVCESGRKATFQFKNEPILETSMTTEPSCCTQNIQFVFRKPGEEEKPIQVRNMLQEKEADIIRAFTEKAALDFPLHQKTFGTHAAMLYFKGSVVYAAEDIGRHNALDKCIGYCYLNEHDAEGCALYTTGRVPLDMLEKVFNAGIPMLVSKSVPTEDAVKKAKESNISLIARAHSDSYIKFA